MKNLPIAIVALLGVCLVVPVATAADGDLNGDGNVDRVDAALLVRNLGVSSGETLPSPQAAPLTAAS